MIIVSTPYGMNQFYKLWTDAENGRNDYVPIEVHWSKYQVVMKIGKKEQLETPEAQFQQEFECEFLGSVNTLISPAKIKTMTFQNPIQSNGGLDVYEQPVKGNTYVCTVDVARGVQKDYSAFVILDVSKMPYKIVAKYRNNDIKPLLFPHTIDKVCKSI